MDTITNSRELFIIEIVINYLQSVYPNIYSDKEIIRRYIEYNKLNINCEHLIPTPVNEIIACLVSLSFFSICALALASTAQVPSSKDAKQKKEKHGGKLLQ